jgi:subtilase family serine protease
MVYQAPQPTLAAFFDLFTAIVDDNKADVVSNSYGECELFFTKAYNSGQDYTYLLRDYHDLFRQGNAQGITFVNASGDGGSFGCPNVAGTHVVPGVIIWADDPAVTGVGGTNLKTSYIKGSLQSTYVSQNAYFDFFSASSGALPGSVWGSGGGKSVVWGKPTYQTFVSTSASTRAVPDLAMHMGGCPVGAVTPCSPDRSFDWAVINGNYYGLIGTSASSPEFAGLQALQNEFLGSRAGNANFIIYALAQAGTIGNGPVYHNDIPGNNGIYVSGPGYNFVVGNGTPRGAQYANDAPGPFAGDPNTPSNP